MSVYRGGSAQGPALTFLYGFTYGRIYLLSCTAYLIVSAVYREDVRTYHYCIGGCTPDTHHNTHITGVDRTIYRYEYTVVIQGAILTETDLDRGVRIRG